VLYSIISCSNFTNNLRRRYEFCICLRIYIGSMQYNVIQNLCKIVFLSSPICCKWVQWLFPTCIFFEIIACTELHLLLCGNALWQQESSVLQCTVYGWSNIAIANITNGFCQHSIHQLTIGSTN
jgi:hypothetical protein